MLIIDLIKNLNILPVVQTAGLCELQSVNVMLCGCSGALALNGKAFWDVPPLGDAPHLHPSQCPSVDCGVSEQQRLPAW